VRRLAFFHSVKFPTHDLSPSIFGVSLSVSGEAGKP
jgi:hypothetical protein